MKKSPTRRNKQNPIDLYVNQQLVRYSAGYYDRNALYKGCFGVADSLDLSSLERRLLEVRK